MRVLYESLFFDVRSPHGVRGPGHVMYRALDRPGVDLRVLGPPPPSAWLAERALRRVYRRLTGRRYLRFLLSQAARASRRLEDAVREVQPDVVLTMFPAALWRYGGAAPAVYRVDTTYRALQREYPERGSGRLSGAAMARFQAAACRRATGLVTHTEWSYRCLQEDCGIDPKRLRVFPNTGGLPPEALPEDPPAPRALQEPIELLFVGLDPRRKGLDTALEAVRELRRGKVDARLRVCGVEAPAGPCPDGVVYAGRYDKSRPDELEAYVEQYRRADLLLQPSRFDPSPMVIAEAAAFGVPTLTHDVTGLASMVRDGESGLVLPPFSSGSSFADAVRHLATDPDLYERLCRGAFRRHWQDFSWNRFGEHLLEALEDAAAL